MPTKTYVPFASPKVVRGNIIRAAKQQLDNKVRSRAYEFTTLDLLGPDAINELKRLPEMPPTLVKMGPQQYLVLMMNGVLTGFVYRDMVYRIVSETTLHPLTKNKRHILTADPMRKVPKGYRLIPVGIERKNYLAYLGRPPVQTKAPTEVPAPATEPPCPAPEPEVQASTPDTDWRGIAMNLVAVNKTLIDALGALQDLLDERK